MAANPFDPRLFRPDAISAETAAFNAQMAAQMKGRPKPWEEPADGSPPQRMFASPTSPRARTVHAEVKGRPPVDLHVVMPETSPKGVYMHIHGGGLVLGSALTQDMMLERVAESTGMAGVSVEYRLAPENPYPAAWDDCESAALWLIKNGKSEFGTDVLTIGGESAGATLAAATLLRMRDRQGYTGFRAANLAYGNFDTSMTPSQMLAPEKGILVGKTGIRKFTEAYLPKGVDARNPDVSALYADLKNMPRAIFTVGTIDPLLDDTLFMYSRWIAAGNEAELAIYPGAPHAFNSFPLPQGPEANARIDAFLKRAIS